MNVEEALRVSITIANLDKLLAQLREEMEDALCSDAQLLMADNARQALAVLKSSLRTLEELDDGTTD